MKKASYLGLDFGSDSVRALLVDEEGLPLAEAVRPYPRWGEGRYTDAAAGRFRQHPLDYVEAMTDAVREALAQGDPASVAGIGVDTTGSTPCLTDAAGLPLALRPEFADDPDAMFILWKDHTALEEADRINEAAHSGDGPDYTAYEGGIYSCEWFWSKVLHVLRANPRVRAAAAGAIEHCDWMPALLVGEKSAEPSNGSLSPAARRSRCAAGHKAMWHASWGGLPPESFFERIDPLLVPIRRAMPGESFTADNPVGRLSPEWAARLGLPAGIPVAGGMVDGHCGAVGAGIRPGTLVKVCGTSACDFLVAERVDGLIPGICGQIDGSIVPGLVGLEAGQAAFGDVYAWLRRFLSYAGDVSVAAIERDAAALAPGSTGLVALDWFNGRRTPYPDDTRTGAIMGLNLGTTVPMVYRALAEATVFGSKRIKDHFAAHGVTADNLVMTGGISRKSPFVMQMFADVFGQPVQIAACDQTCALGAAIFAAVAAGAYASVPEAMDHMASRIDRVYRPDPAAGEIYAKLYSKYCQLAAAGGKLATNG